MKQFLQGTTLSVVLRYRFVKIYVRVLFYKAWMLKVNVVKNIEHSKCGFYVDSSKFCGPHIPPNVEYYEEQ